MAVEEVLNEWLKQARYNSYTDSFEFNVSESLFEKKIVKVTREQVESNPYMVCNKLNATSAVLERLKQTKIQRYSYIDPYTQSLVVADNTKTGRLEFNPNDGLYSALKYAQEFEQKRVDYKVERKQPKYKVLDFDDNILGETFTIDEALKTFKNRYEFFTKESALPFIYEL